MEEFNRHATTIAQHPGTSVEPPMEPHSEDATSAEAKFFDHAVKKNHWVTDCEMIRELAAHLYAVRISRDSIGMENAMMLQDALYALHKELEAYTQKFMPVPDVPPKEAGLPWL